MTSIVFNSVPMEDIDQSWGANPQIDRVNALIREIKRYGVVDVFEPEDLIELRNIPKVTKCLAQLSKLVSHYQAIFKLITSIATIFSFPGCIRPRQPFVLHRLIRLQSVMIYP